MMDLARADEESATACRGYYTVFAVASQGDGGARAHSESHSLARRSRNQEEDSNPRKHSAAGPHPKQFALTPCPSPDVRSFLARERGVQWATARRNGPGSPRPPRRIPRGAKFDDCVRLSSLSHRHSEGR